MTRTQRISIARRARPAKVFHARLSRFRAATSDDIYSARYVPVKIPVRFRLMREL